MISPLTQMHLETFTRVINIYAIQQGGRIEKTFFVGLQNKKVWEALV